MMDKTININLGGSLFHIDGVAYSILRDYLQSIDQKFRNSNGGSETIEDIESRIAEIFLSKKGTAGVISKENVEEMIGIIGNPEDFGSYNAVQSPDRYNHPGSHIGHAINEVFKAFGKVFFLTGRIILIIFGTSLVLTGFLALLAFLMVFVFKFPGVYSPDASGINIAYLPDFLYYAITPNIVPWVKGLLILVVTIPLLAIIYGGVRMIFWFRSRDGYFWLAGLVLWVMSVATLSVLFFNEGIGFSETENSVFHEYFSATPDTLYIISGRKIIDLNAKKEISIPDEKYNLFLSEEKKEIYIRTNLDIVRDENKSASVEIRKRSAGRSRIEALENTKRLEYNSHISGDTLILDEFSTIPAGFKWSLDYVGVTVHVPDQTVIHMDKTTESLFHSKKNNGYVTNPENRFWLMTEEGLDYIGNQDKSEK